MTEPLRRRPLPSRPCPECNDTGWVNETKPVEGAICCVWCTSRVCPNGCPTDGRLPTLHPAA